MSQHWEKAMSSKLRLAGRNALITGSDTGIGREIAHEFAREGADIVLHYCHHQEGAESLAKEIIDMGRRVAVVHADFDDLNDVTALADRALEAIGPIDCLVNNAGITFNSPFLKIRPEQFDKLFNVNFRAQFFLTQSIVANMLKHSGGTVCNISSIHGLQGAPEHSAYAATKGAIIACTRTLSVELAHLGVRVNGIAPGWITVENYYKAIPNFNEEQAKQDAYNAVPIARYGQPLDVARLAVFLSCDESSFMVGQTITLDGGTTALMSLVSDFRSESTARFGKEYISETKP